MSLTPSGSRGHKIKRHARDDFEISWHVYIKHGRLLHAQAFSRWTTRAGAERFAKKWKIEMPPEPSPGART